jgi:hypothetical protein
MHKSTNQQKLVTNPMAGCRLNKDKPMKPGMFLVRQPLKDPRPYIQCMGREVLILLRHCGATDPAAQMVTDSSGQ